MLGRTYRGSSQVSPVKFNLGSFDFGLEASGNFWGMLISGAFFYLQKYAAAQISVQCCLVAKNDRDALKGVAGQLGFSSEFYFSHFSRHHTGMAPPEFRNHLRG